MPGGAYFGLGGVIPNKLYVCLGRPKGLEYGKDTWREAPTMPPNSPALIRQGSWVEAGQIIRFQVFGRQGAVFETTEVVGRLPIFRLLCLSLSFYNDISVTPQVVTGVQNLMRQRAHLFHRLEAIETMRAFVVHNVDGNEDLLANLETTKSEVAAA